jgi:acetyl esterase
VSIPEDLNFQEVVSLLEQMSPEQAAASIGPPTPTAALVAAFPRLAEVEFADVNIDVGDAPVPARRYRSTVSPTRAGLVWVHGGGFIGGDLHFPEAHWVALSIAQHGFAVLSVDYRKCLHGVHHPAPSDDVLTAWRWAIDNAAELGTTPALLHLGGASAGANLAAGVSKRLRDAGEDRPRSVVLVYPLVHPELPPMSGDLRLAVAGDASALRPTMVREICLNFVGSEAGFTDPYAFAAIGDVGNQPPVYVLNAEIDTLRASGEAYAAQLAAAGVEVEVEMEPDARHGHLNEPFGGLGSRSLERMVSWLERRMEAG